MGATPANSTKNFLVSDILSLQDVLNAAHLSNIILTGNITQSGGALSLGGTVRDFNGDLGANGETLVCNASGQLVFGSGLTNQNLDQVLAVGNTGKQYSSYRGFFTQTGTITQTGGSINLTGNITQVGNAIQSVELHTYR